MINETWKKLSNGKMELIESVIVEDTTEENVNVYDIDIRIGKLNNENVKLRDDINSLKNDIKELKISINNLDKKLI